MRDRHRRHRTRMSRSLSSGRASRGPVGFIRATRLRVDAAGIGKPFRPFGSSNRDVTLHQGGAMNKQTRFHIGYWIAAMVGLLVVQYAYATAQRVAPIPYSQFQQLLHDGKIAEIGVSDRYIQGKLKEPLPNGKSQFVTTRIDPQFADELQKYGVTYTGEVESTLLQDLLSWIVP